LPFHEGYAAWNPAWKTATDPAAWIRNSVVWFSQRFTEWLGEARLQHYVEQFHYGNEDISGGITAAWLSSSLQISPIEQVAFLEKVAGRRLPVSAHAYEMTNRITTVAALANGWDVHGKTGTGSPRKANGSPDEAHSYGWFAGWAFQEAGRTIVFARLIQDDQQEAVSAGLRAREAFLRELPSLLNPN
jgi:beta-lactamase class D/beta-lactamase class D OXA-42